MSESKTYTTNVFDHCASPVLYNSDDVFYSTRTSRDFEVISPTKHGRDDYQRRSSDGFDSTLINWPSLCQRSSSTNAIDQTLSVNINRDPYPEYVRRPNHNQITYRQDISVRYLQPPTPPPSGPLIIREIHAPQPLENPPLVIRQPPPVSTTPPPIIIRERPPIPPPIEPSRIITRYLPPLPPPPRKVIVERQAPLPQKPQSIIVEKWLPYKPPPQRRVLVERAQPLMPKPAQKNTIITYDAPRVTVVKNFRNLGTVRADPNTYSLQYGSQLSSSEYVQNTMARFGLGNNYSQMIQMQTSPHSSGINSSHFQAIDSHSNNQPSINYGEHSVTSTCQVQNGDHLEYIEKRIEEVVSPDGRRSQRSSISGSNEQEVLGQAELSN